MEKNIGLWRKSTLNLKLAYFTVNIHSYLKKSYCFQTIFYFAYIARNSNISHELYSRKGCRITKSKVIRFTIRWHRLAEPFYVWKLSSNKWFIPVGMGLNRVQRIDTLAHYTSAPPTLQGLFPELWLYILHPCFMNNKLWIDCSLISSLLKFGSSWHQFIKTYRYLNK